MAETESNDMPSMENTKPKLPILVFFNDAKSVFKKDALGMEILRIAFPAAMALAADPIASLIDTAFIGHLGPVEVAAVGVSIAIFNQVSKVAIYPLVSITTSLVAQEDTISRINDEQQECDETVKESHENNDVKVDVVSKYDSKINIMENGSTETDAAKENEKESNKNYEVKVVVPDESKINNLEEGSAENDTELKSTNFMTVDAPDIIPNNVESKSVRRVIPSASTAMVLGGVLGLVQTLFLIFLAKPFLSIMDVKSGSPMLLPALRYLTIRSIGSPAVLLSLAMQGIFRGFKDTTTPLYATVVGDLMNIILDPIFIFVCRLGVSGAAIAHVLSQYLIALILVSKLLIQVDLLPPSIRDLQLNKFLKNGFLLPARVVATTICTTLATFLSARLGTTTMAAFQICLQVWLTSSLLADGLAVAGQAILACAFAEKDYKKASVVAARVLQMGFVLGLGLALVVGLGLQFGSGVFSKDKGVIRMITIGIPFVAATQPINSLAFVFDGVNFGASDFAYSAYSMVIVSLVTIGLLFVLAKTIGFVGIWLALTIYMFLRIFAGIWRMGTGTGPWHFLKGRSTSIA